MQFGLWASCPENAEVAWGARAILENGTFSLLWDRQSWKGPEEKRGQFSAMLNNGILKAVDKKVRELLDKGEMREDEAKEFVLYHDDKAWVLGNTNASFGYLYMIAFPSNDGNL